jgi:hypothetical protein
MEPHHLLNITITGRNVGRDSLPCGSTNAPPEERQAHAFRVAHDNLVPNLKPPRSQQEAQPSASIHVPAANGRITASTGSKGVKCIRFGTCSYRAHQRRRLGG